MGLRVSKSPADNLDDVKGLVAKANENDFADEKINPEILTEEQKAAIKGREVITTSINDAIDFSLKTDKENNFVDNGLGDRADINPNNQQERLIDSENKLKGFNTSLLSGEFNDRVNQFLDKNSRTSALIKDRIKQLEQRKTSIDFTPLLALSDDPNTAKLLAPLFNRNAFTDKDKEDAIFNMKLKLAKHDDNIAFNLAKIEDDQDTKQIDFIAKTSQFEKTRSDKRNEEIKDDFRNTFTKMTKEKNWQAAETSIKNSDWLVRAAADPKNYDANGKLKPSVSQDFRFRRARQLNGAGVLTNVDFSEAGPAQTANNQMKLFFEKVSSGNRISQTDIIDFVNSARTQANAAQTYLGTRSKAFSANAPDFIGISKETAQRAADRHINFIISDTPKRLSNFKIPTKIVEEKQKGIPEAAQAGTAGILRSIGEATGGIVSGIGEATSDLFDAIKQRTIGPDETSAEADAKLKLIIKAKRLEQLKAAKAAKAAGVSGTQ